MLCSGATKKKLPRPFICNFIYSTTQPILDNCHHKVGNNSLFCAPVVIYPVFCECFTTTQCFSFCLLLYSLFEKKIRVLQYLQDFCDDNQPPTTIEKTIAAQQKKISSDHYSTLWGHAKMRTTREMGEHVRAQWPPSTTTTTTTNSNYLKKQQQKKSDMSYCFVTTLAIIIIYY
jgi:hypothetical protein